MLHLAIYWPKGGKAEVLLKGIASYINKLLNDPVVYLAFERYVEYSINSDTLLERFGQLRRAHYLLVGPSLPSKDIVM